MNLGDYEDSESLSRPVVLIRFDYGPGDADYIGYTSADRALEFDEKTYLPIALSHDNIRAGVELDRVDIKISLPNDCEAARLFSPMPPQGDVTVTVLQVQEGDTSLGYASALPQAYNLSFTGYVKSTQVSGRICEFTCETIAASLSRVGLRKNYQLGCSHVLYGEQCRAHMADFTYTGPALDVGTYSPLSAGSQDFVTIAKPAGRVAKDFLGGILMAPGPRGPEARTIIRASDEAPDSIRLVLNTTHPGLVPGAVVSASLGCPRTLESCQSIFNNAVNFGGFPWIPLENPIHSSFLS